MWHETNQVLDEVLGERMRQHDLWGQQDHDESVWMIILMEEVGEAAKACFENNADNYREELVQVAAVAVAMVEAFDRKFPKEDNVN